jgi:hypothetical protein
VASNATSLGVVDLESDLRSNLGTLNIEEASPVSICYSLDIYDHLLDVMCRYVENREEEHSVSDLSMEPL